MKPKKISDPNLEEILTGKIGTSRHNHLKEKNKTAINDAFLARGNTPRKSLIPKLKINNNEAKGTELKFTKSVKPSKISSTYSALNARYRFSSIYQKPVEDKKSKVSDTSCKASRENQETQSQKIHIWQPDPQEFCKTEEDEVLFNFKNSVRQISEVWLKTSADLSNSIKMLNNKSLDPIEFQQESIKIQMAIQQAKSLTVLKTKSIMAELKMLLHNGETVDSELKYFLHNETPESEKEMFLFSENESRAKSAADQKFGGMGDLPRRREKNGEKKIEDDNFEETNIGRQTTRIEKTDSFLLRKKDERSRSWNDSEPTDNIITLEKKQEELMSELLKKNETITHLNNKIFQLQKTCEEHLQLRNCLQIKLAEYHEKIQWNHILWKQIGKLKVKIKEFQEGHAKLDREKRALENKIANQEKQAEGTNELRNLFNKREFLFGEQESFRGRIDEDVTREGENDWDKKLTDKKILEEKQNSINVLKMVLNVMVDQESLAQKQIAVFQSKIKELESCQNVKCSLFNRKVVTV